MRRISPGSPEPLGATLVKGGANIAVFSAHATAIEVCLFDTRGATEQERVFLPERTGDVFHGVIAGIVAGDRYGLRAHGPYDVGNGHRFNRAKLLVDPYAKALDRRFAFHPAMVGTSADGAARDVTDSAPYVPKGIVTAPVAPAEPNRPRVPWDQTIVYELHVRGFTRTHPGVPDALRGTCDGLAHPAAFEHLARLGITTVELMPITAAIDERHLARVGLTNYWGYNPAALFVPDPRLAPRGIAEVTACVAALQAAGIEVILDLVLNHTGEGDAQGPTFSLRGLDNATYYRGVPDDRGRYVDDTGCGNTLALDRPPVLRLAMDVLRYYAVAAGVDGFRFDLATTLARRDDGFDPAAPLLQAIAQDPVLRHLKLIAEPWDVGPGGPRLGAFPPAWGEWNDRFRDAARRFWRGDDSMTGELATRIAGSADIFAVRRRPPSRSVNFVTSHDGFTLADLPAYATKHNEANGEGNRDGADANFSWNHGIEGPAADRAIDEARRRDMRNLLATLLLARGTPMLAMGDELGRTQQGNNNAYAQDNALTWIDWESADGAQIAYVATIIELRKRHPALRLDRWLAGAPIDASGIPDVEWRHPDGRPMTDLAWRDSGARTLVAALYASDGETADRVVVAFNATDQSIPVRCPDPRAGFAWRRVVDTSSATGRHDFGTSIEGELANVAHRSVVLLVEERDRSPGPRGAGVDPAVLDRLAGAAGIDGEWWDMTGQRHVVGTDTKRALLAAMGLGAASTDEARSRLTEIVNRRERRPLPEFVVARAASPATIAIALDGDPARTRVLCLRHEDGSERVLPFVADDLPANVVTAADGRTVVQRQFVLPSLPAGHYTLDLGEDPQHLSHVVVAPDRCFLPSELRGGARRFGLAAHLYALRRRGDQGIGDFTTLSMLSETTARAGASIIGINPLHALFNEDRDRASPYHPSDRRFLDPIYIDVQRVPGFADARRARQSFERNEAGIAALATGASVDYAAVWQIKRAVLEACFAAFESRATADPLHAEFDRFVSAGGGSLQRFAIFEAIAAAHPRQPWHQWPKEFRAPEAPGVAAFVARNASAMRFALYLQWLADRQLGEAAANARASGLALGFFRDLAVGAAPDGAEVWANPMGFANDVSIGAPPDPFSTAGQNWHLPPPMAGVLIAPACAGFRALLAANMRHAGALRIDHVMGLARLFWIPAGAAPVEGAYVRYPEDALRAVLALESDRAQCLIVGEDLGTVPEGFRERLAAADVLSYRVVWFERDGVAFAAPARYPAKSATCVSTHDLPTIAGWWEGADIAEKRSLGLMTPTEEEIARAERLASKRALVEAIEQAGTSSDPRLEATAPHDGTITAAIHRYACASTSALVLIQADDLAGETVALNLPGTDRARPNWRRKVRVDVAALWETPAARQLIVDCAGVRTGG